MRDCKLNGIIHNILHSWLDSGCSWLAIEMQNNTTSFETGISALYNCSKYTIQLLFHPKELFARKMLKSGHNPNFLLFHLDKLKSKANYISDITIDIT